VSKFLFEGFSAESAEIENILSKFRIFNKQAALGSEGKILSPLGP
jgi:hypothetical protein